jgi:hypothetical protein
VKLIHLLLDIQSLVVIVAYGLGLLGTFIY